LSIRPILSLFQWLEKKSQLRFDLPETAFIRGPAGNLINLYQIPIGQRAKARYNLAQRPPESNGQLNPKLATPCKHPRVRVVSRQEDVEYVECVECGEVFDSDEFRDMEIEEKVSNPEEDVRDD
jgi:Zn ribbon nucleic-acid-binding protein